MHKELCVTGQAQWNPPNVESGSTKLHPFAYTLERISHHTSSSNQPPNLVCWASSLTAAEGLISRQLQQILIIDSQTNNSYIDCTGKITQVSDAEAQKIYDTMQLSTTKIFPPIPIMSS